MHPRLRTTEPSKDRPPAARGNRRRGSIALELVLVLPVLITLIAVIVAFGMFHANMQQIALAARAGAEAASQTDAYLLGNDGDPVPDEVIRAVEIQLQSSRIDYCGIRLEHNLDGEQVVLVSHPDGGDCASGEMETLEADAPPRKYVRLTVCVPRGRVMPPHLSMLGPILCGPSQTVGSTSIFRYELQP
ncbi:MAG: pilus assembly protein [Candidatus Nealsonbacteria bacterium]|nr:pilus assembly protein [Candidatus Nealsonbacteria bacterium]